MSSFSPGFFPPAKHRFGPLDLVLILLGTGIAYWLIPGLTEGLGF